MCPGSGRWSTPVPPATPRRRPGQAPPNRANGGCLGPAEPPGDRASGSFGGLPFEDGLQPGEVGLVPPADQTSHQGLQRYEHAAELDLIGPGHLGAAGHTLERDDVVGPEGLGRAGTTSDVLAWYAETARPLCAVRSARPDRDPRVSGQDADRRTARRVTPEGACPPSGSGPIRWPIVRAAPPVAREATASHAAGEGRGTRRARLRCRATCSCRWTG
jgi:hypothetical protein